MKKIAIIVFTIFLVSCSTTTVKFNSIVNNNKTQTTVLKNYKIGEEISTNIGETMLDFQRSYTQDNLYLCLMTQKPWAQFIGIIEIKNGEFYYPLGYTDSGLVISKNYYLNNFGLTINKNIGIEINKNGAILRGIG